MQTPACRLISVNLFCVKVNPATKNTDKYEYIKLCGFIQAQSHNKNFQYVYCDKIIWQKLCIIQPQYCLPEQFALKAKFIFIHFAVAIIVNLCYNYDVIF